MGNCPENAARHLINPFCPVLQSRVCESWEEYNRDHFEEVPLGQPLVIRHLGRSREPRTIARRANFTAGDVAIGPPWTMRVSARTRSMADNQAGRPRISNHDQPIENRPFRKSYALPYLAEQRTWSIGINRKAERRGDRRSGKASGQQRQIILR